MTLVSVEHPVSKKHRTYKRTGGKECSRCENPPMAGSRYCTACHAAYMRTWRASNPMTAEQRWKDRARSYANICKRRGKLEQKPCTQCGSGLSQMHHGDYDKPLDVQWLCRRCHLALHRLEGPTLTLKALAKKWVETADLARAKRYQARKRVKQ